MSDISNYLGEVADKLYTLRQQRYDLQKQIDAIAIDEAAHRKYLIANLPNELATGIAGTLCRVSIIKQEVPSVTNWDAFYRYIQNTGAFELIQKRVSALAVKERWDALEELPGVVHFSTITLSINKL